MPTGDVPYPALPPSPAERLLKKARTRFPDLNTAEEKMVRAAAEGEWAEIGTGPSTGPFIDLLRIWLNIPASFRLSTSRWDRAVIARMLNIDFSRLTIRATVLGWLCTNHAAVKLVHAKGVQIQGAVITGYLDLDSAQTPRPLVFLACDIRETISARDAHFAILNMAWCAGKGLKADRARFDRGLYLRNGTCMTGEVRVLGATIGGNFDCTGGRLENSVGRALSADSVRVRGNVYLSNGFHATGEVRLIGATIGRDLICKGGRFENPNGHALCSDHLQVGGSIHLCKAFHATGEVRLLGATMGGDLSCTGGRFDNPGGDALTADRLRVRGTVNLRQGFHATGVVRFPGATIGGDLECTGARFENANGDALIGQSARIAGNVFLGIGFQTNGDVRFVLSNIGGVLDMRDWGRDDLTTPETTERFLYGTLDLSLCRVGTLHDDARTIEWLDKNKDKNTVLLHGFTYTTLAQSAPKEAETRVAWLRLHPEEHFTPQPYGQLARVLDSLGHADDARAIRVAAAKDAANHQLLQTLSLATNSRSQRLTARTRWLGQWFLGLLLGHGYYPLRPLWGMLAFLLLGWFVFSIGQAHMRPSSDQVLTSTEYLRDGSIPPEYPRLQTLVYSADLLLPIIDLDQANYWRPYPESPPCGSGWFTVTAGECLRAYAWIHVLAGWTFSTFLIIGLTGLVKKELPEADSPNT